MILIYCITAVSQCLLNVMWLSALCFDTNVSSSSVGFSCLVQQLSSVVCSFLVNFLVMSVYTHSGYPCFIKC